MTTQEAYEICEQIIRKHSATFYSTFRLLEKQDRQAVYAIYAFCRIVDDIVDEGRDVRVELEQFKDEFESFLLGEYSHHQAHWVALHDVFVKYPMDSKPFYDMIVGQEMDITISRYETLKELETYSYHVATTVGLMLLPVLVTQVTDETIQSAYDIGYALQLTNILRDIGEDLGRNRIYIPNEILYAYGLDVKAIEQKVVTPEFIEVWESLAKIAEFHYDRAKRYADAYPRRARIVVFGAAQVYRAILTEIRRKNYDVFTTKNFVSVDEKQQIIQMIQEKW